MFRFAFVVLVAAVCAAFPASIQAQVIVDKGAKIENPTVVFRGISGNSELSEAVRSDLIHCGWFNVLSSGASEYIISGSASGNLLKLDVANGAGVPMHSISTSGTTTRTTSHVAVDQVLKKLFNIEGICRTKIVFAAESAKNQKEIFMCDFDGQDLKQITSNATLCIDPQWGPRGKTVIYSFYGRTFTHLVEYDIASGLSRKLTQFPGINAGGAVSPDGRFVALILARDNQVDLYYRDYNGSNLVRLTQDKAVEASPCWSPDGRKICFVSDKSGRPRLYLIDPFRRTAPVALSGTFGSERVAPCWSKDNRIAYSSKLGSSYTVAVVDLSASVPVDEKVGRPGSNPIPGEGPSWAPDNRHVVVADGGSIYIVDTRLGKTRSLFRSGSSKVSGPDWSPILY